MATEIVKHTYKLKRATAARWRELNPILNEGEPGFVLDENRLKIGDGFTPWNALEYIDGVNDIITLDNKEELPEKGDPRVIYRDAKNRTLYQYNPITEEYETLNQGEVNVDNITLIYGGNAND